jgi:2-(1,2-epoxy-1,2-dihydrophenyl)acetyl-CoA isomerase
MHDPRAIPTDVAGLEVRREGALLRIRLSRPDKRNAISRAMMQGLVACIENAPDHEEIRAIELSGAGDHFCGGADWVATNDPAKQRPRVGSIHRRTYKEAHRFIHALINVQMPVVCKVRGWAAGIGCHIACAADFTLAANDARFSEPFALRGFSPDSGGSWFLPRLIGVARAKRLLLLGEEISGEQAADWGLIHAALPAEQLDAAADALLERLVELPTAAVGFTKYLVHRSLELDLEHALEQEAFALELTSRSLDFKEGLAAFKEKRRPRYEGR